MRKAFVFSLLTILVITGCQTKELAILIPNEEPEVIIQDSKVFTAIIDDDFSAETKTSLDGEGNVLWKQFDQVSIFAGSTVNEQYQVTDASDGKTAATLDKVGGSGFVAGTEIDNNVAFYPYASTAEIAKSGGSYVISEIELPATQNYAAGSFGNGAFPMAAVTSSTEDMSLKFKNILGGLKLQLKGTAIITSITVTGNNNEILCGDAEVTTSYGSVPSIALSDASAKTVTLDCGAGVALNTETATPFIIALPPITMTGGFTVLVTDTEGKEMEISTSKSQTITRSSLLRMPVVNYVGTVDYLTEPLTFTSTGSTSVSLRKVDTPYDITLEYKKGSGEWTSYTIGSDIALADGESLQFRAGSEGNATFGKTYSDYYYFYIDGAGTVEASGNIMSLLDSNLTINTMPEYGFKGLFKNCRKLVNVENLKLPATIMADVCYQAMFSGCTGLTTVPELPATTLANECYASMFSGCTGLTTAPELPVTTLAEYCYNGMFRGCTTLTTAPDLPATTLAGSCYSSMFSGCTGLTTAPELPATTLADRCYGSMFYGCTGLTTAPELPATTLAYMCYATMFGRCEDLVSAPELPATTLAEGCYISMFSDCTGLTTAPELPVTTLADYCYNGMFVGCTTLTTAPELPATTLAEYCYNGMFVGCTTLTTAPELPANKLVEGCYSQMFLMCSNLNYIKMLATDISASNSLNDWVSGVSETGTFIKSSSATWNVTGNSGVPSGWTIETECTLRN